jgi:hypothetical protein
MHAMPCYVSEGFSSLDRRCVLQIPRYTTQTCSHLILVDLFNYCLLQTPSQFHSASEETPSDLPCHMHIRITTKPSHLKRMVVSAVSIKSLQLTLADQSTLASI